jgi:hypothetical protein
METYFEDMMRQFLWHLRFGFIGGALGTFGLYPVHRRLIISTLSSFTVTCIVIILGQLYINRQLRRRQ